MEEGGKEEAGVGGKSEEKSGKRMEEWEGLDKRVEEE